MRKAINAVLFRIQTGLSRLTPLKWTLFLISTIVAAAISFYTVQFLKRMPEPLEIEVDLGRTTVASLSALYDCDLRHSCPIDYAPIFVVHNKSDEPVVLRDFRFRSLVANRFFEDEETHASVQLCSYGTPLVEMGENYTADGGDIENARIPPDRATTIPAGETRLLRVSFSLVLSAQCPVTQLRAVTAKEPIATKDELLAQQLGRHPNYDAHAFQCHENVQSQMTVALEGNRSQIVTFSYPIFAKGDRMILFKSLIGCSDTVASTKDG